ncbi:MAG TPA: single-stranded DNA-binding protein [Blastocatellia bacterium]|nr:single-stranded DNA-binding protein [Blastocatellia bacterium]
MASFNRVTIVGYLGRDPELRYTPQGTAVCDFSVATTERRKDKSGEFQDVTTWFRVTFWAKMAETASQYLAKGKMVFVEGRLSQREWQDRDGHTRYSLEVAGTDLQFLSPRSDDPLGARSGPVDKSVLKEESPAREESTAITDDDIPF